MRPLAASRCASSSVSAQIAADGDRDARGRESLGGLEAVAVLRRDGRSLGVDEVGERVGQAELRGPDRALRRGAEQPRLRLLVAAGQRPAEPREGMVGGEGAVVVREQLGQLLREVVGAGRAAVALEREGRHRVGARGAPDAEVDTAGEEPGEHAEGLRDLERRVVREHHAAAADADARGRRGHRADQRLRARAGQRRPAVMLGQPVAVVAEAVGQPCEVERVGERVGAGGALRHRRLVEHAEPHALQASRVAGERLLLNHEAPATGATDHAARERGRERVAEAAGTPQPAVHPLAERRGGRALVAPPRAALSTSAATSSSMSSSGTREEDCWTGE